jgi:hypothetical protein
MAKEEKKRHALWMPGGSVRALLLVLIAGGGVALLIKGITFSDWPDWFVAVIAAAIAYHVGAHIPIGWTKKSIPGSGKHEKEGKRW